VLTLRSIVLACCCLLGLFPALAQSSRGAWDAAACGCTPPYRVKVQTLKNSFGKKNPLAIALLNEFLSVQQQDNAQVLLDYAIVNVQLELREVSGSIFVQELNQALEQINQQKDSPQQKARQMACYLAEQLHRGEKTPAPPVQDPNDAPKTIPQPEQTPPNNVLERSSNSPSGGRLQKQAQDSSKIIALQKSDFPTSDSSDPMLYALLALLTALTGLFLWMANQRKKELSQLHQQLKELEMANSKLQMNMQIVQKERNFKAKDLFLEQESLRAQLAALQKEKEEYARAMGLQKLEKEVNEIKLSLSQTQHQLEKAQQENQQLQALHQQSQQLAKKAQEQQQQTEQQLKKIQEQQLATQDKLQLSQQQTKQLSQELKTAQEQLQQAQAKEQQAQQQVQQIQKNLQQNQSQLEQSQQQNQTLNKNLQNTQQQLQQTQQQLQQQQQNLQLSQQQLQSTQLKLQQAEQLLQQTEQIKQQTNQQYTQLQQQQAQLKKQWQEQQSLAQQQTEQIRRLEKDLQRQELERKNTLQQSQQQQQIWQTEKQNLEATLSQLRKQNQLLQLEQQQIQEKTQQQQAQNLQEAQKQIKEYQTKQQELEQKQKEYLQEKQQLQNQILALQKGAGQESQQLQQALQEQKNLQERLVLAGREAQDLKNSLLDLEQSKEQELKQLRQALEKAQQQSPPATAPSSEELDRLARELAALKIEKMQTANLLRDKDKTLEQVQRELRGLKTKLQELELEKSQLESQQKAKRHFYFGMPVSGQHFHALTAQVKANHPDNFFEVIVNEQQPDLASFKLILDGYVLNRAQIKQEDVLNPTCLIRGQGKIRLETLQQLPGQLRLKPDGVTWVIEKKIVLAW
jgi:chromosome segregation ATPase